jgi:hypothetical protein
MSFPIIEQPQDTDIIYNVIIDPNTFFFKFNDTLFYHRAGKFEDVTRAHLGMLLQPGMSQTLDIPKCTFGKAFSFFKLAKKLDQLSYIVCSSDYEDPSSGFNEELAKSLGSTKDEMSFKLYTFKLKQCTKVLKDYFDIEEERFLTSDEKEYFKEMIIQILIENSVFAL